VGLGDVGWETLDVETQGEERGMGLQKILDRRELRTEEGERVDGVSWIGEDTVECIWVGEGERQGVRGIGREGEGVDFTKSGEVG